MNKFCTIRNNRYTVYADSLKFTKIAKTMSAGDMWPIYLERVAKPAPKFLWQIDYIYVNS